MSTITVPAVRAAESASPLTDKSDVPPALWKRVFNKVRTKGTYNPPEPPMPATMGFAVKVGDLSGKHTADYIDLWGGIDDNGEFFTYQVAIVSERWAPRDADGNLHMDQWLHQLDVDGKHERAVHVLMVKTPYGLILDYKSQAYPPSDPRAAKSLQEIMSMWDAYEPGHRLAGEALSADQMSRQPAPAVDLAPVAASPLAIEAPTI